MNHPKKLQAMLDRQLEQDYPKCLDEVQQKLEWAVGIIKKAKEDADQ